MWQSLPRFRFSTGLSYLLLCLIIKTNIVPAETPPGTQNPSDVSDVPYMHNVVCSSPLEDSDRHVILMPGLSFHWKHDENQWDKFTGTLKWDESEDAAWLALGVSGSGEMIGSKAFIGQPNSGVKVYQISSQDPGGAGLQEFVGIDSNGEFFGQQPSYGTTNSSTTLQFDLKQFGSVVREAHSDQNPNVITFIFAVGQSGTLGYHKHRGSFRLNTITCPPPKDPLTIDHNTGSGTTTEDANTASSSSVVVHTDHIAAFKAHGFFATLAFAVIMPCALTAAWFRVLIPKSWIYVHVSCQCLATFFATVAIACAFAGVVLCQKAGENDRGHMIITHHWVGLVLFILVLFQVANGFRRPPIEAKTDPTQSAFEDEKRCLCGLIKVPQSSRDRWHWLHWLSALTIVGMVLYQLQSGIKLYTSEYGGNTQVSLAVLWCWVGVLVIIIVFMKCLLSNRAKQTRSSASFPTNLMPQRGDDDYDEPEGPYSPQSSSSQLQEETQRFNNVI